MGGARDHAQCPVRAVTLRGGMRRVGAAGHGAVGRSPLFPPDWQGARGDRAALSPQLPGSLKCEGPSAPWHSGPGRPAEGGALRGEPRCPASPANPGRRAYGGRRAPRPLPGIIMTVLHRCSHGPVGAGGIHPGRPAVLRLGIAEYIKGSTLIFWGLPQQGMLPKLLR